MLDASTDAGFTPAAGPSPLNGAANVRHVTFARGDHAELADEALAELLAGRRREWAIYDGEVYIYAPGAGIYDAIPDYQIRSVVKSFAGTEIESGNPKKKGEVVRINASTTKGAYDLMRDDLRSAMAHYGVKGFADAPNGLCFANGFATVRDGQVRLTAHSPAHLARHRYDFDYAPRAEPPRALLHFFESLFRDCSPRERADRIATIQEYIGACLLGEATKYQRCLVVYATGGNGKSELMTIVEGIFPAGTVASLAPHQWSHNFRAIMLDGKLANLVDEMPSDEMTSSESFKNIVTGGVITGERKNRDPVRFRPIAGHIFNANQPIRSADHSDGFWRRPLIVALTRVFQTADYSAPELERGIGRRVLESDMPGIVAWALEGAARLQRQGSYTESAQSRAYVKAWRDDSDQVRGYIAEYPITERIPASHLYSLYVEWTKSNGHKPLSATSFGQRIVAAGLASRVKNSRVFYEPPIDPAEAMERAAIQEQGEPEPVEVAAPVRANVAAEPTLCPECSKPLEVGGVAVAETDGGCAGHAGAGEEMQV